MTTEQAPYDTNEIRWLCCKRIDGGDWQIVTISNRVYPCDIDETKMFDETPIGVMQHSEFGIFRNRAGWQDTKPFRYLDCRDHSHDLIGSAVGGLVNAVNSDFTINGGK